jgi:uncharacterized phiE125 gp8 family phage protein
MVSLYGGTATLSVPPATEPLDSATVCCFLRLYDPLDPEAMSLLEGMIEAVRIYAETYTNRSMITQTWSWEGTCGANGSVTLWRPPLSVLHEARLQGSASGLGVITTADTAHYRLDPVCSLLQLPDTWAHRRVAIRYSAGYGDTAQDVPAALRQGMLQHLGILYHSADTQAAGAAATMQLVHGLYAPFRYRSVATATPLPTPRGRYGYHS